MRCVHVIGAGLAGLSAAVRLARTGGMDVVVHEAAKHAGGRCRSFHEPVLDTVIDNGTHLMLDGNTEVWDYLSLIGAENEVRVCERAAFPFFDRQSGARWTLDLGNGRSRMALARTLLTKPRAPGLSMMRLLADVRALKRGRSGTIGACLEGSPLFATFWEPLALAVLNTHPREAAAELLYRVLELTVLRGGAFARPLLTRQGLGSALVEPALSTLNKAGGKLFLGQRIRALSFADGRVSGLDHAGGSEVLGAGDAVVLAVPPKVALELLPGVNAPTRARAILNVHYRLPQGVDAPPMTGLVNAHAQWVFVRGGVASVTVSASDKWMDKDADDIAHDLWTEVAQALGLETIGMTPTNRVIKERRATFAQTPESLTHRPGALTAYENLFLAGDWTDTGLPATIEGALKSGRVAAELVLNA